MDKLFARFAAAAAKAAAKVAGSPPAFLVCGLLVLAWAATGPLVGFSQAWRWAMGASTSIGAFLMVLLIQHTQNRDGEAVRAKLDQLILASGPQSPVIGIEKLTEAELAAMHAQCAEHARLAQNQLDRVSAEREARKASRASPKAKRPSIRRPPARNAPARRVRTS